MNIGQSIKAFRVRSGLRQNAYAGKIGITQTYLSQIENNKRKVSTECLERIAKYHGIPIQIMLWYSLDVLDIKAEKVALFKQLKPSIDSLIDNLI